MKEEDSSLVPRESTWDDRREPRFKPAAPGKAGDTSPMTSTPVHPAWTGVHLLMARGSAPNSNKRFKAWLKGI